MSYNTPPHFSSAQPTPPRQEIDFSVLSDAFNLLFRHWQVYIIPGLIIMLMYLPAMVIAYWPLAQQIMGVETSIGNQFASLGLQLMLTVFASLITMFLYPAVVKFTLNVINGAPASVADLWTGFRDPLGYFAVMFLVGLVSVIGVVACCIGVIFTSGLVMFALPHKVATGATASQSISLSWELLKKDWLLAGVFYLVVSIIGQLGSVACYIGLIVTIPFLYIAPTILYCRYTGITPAPTSDPISPYPRSGTYGQNIGEQPRGRQDETPPSPYDHS